MNNNNGSYKKPKRYNLWQSFSFALQGILFALKWERNLRIHLSAALYVTYFTIRYYSLTPAETVALVLAITFVISSELMNTAIEKTVDLKSPDYNALAKIAKDVAAGAVFIASLGSVIVGIILLWDIDIIKTILSHMYQRLYIWLPLIIANLCIIFLPEKNGKNGN